MPKCRRPAIIHAEHNWLETCCIVDFQSAGLREFDSVELLNDSQAGSLAIQQTRSLRYLNVIEAICT